MAASTPAPDPEEPKPEEPKREELRKDEGAASAGKAFNPADFAAGPLPDEHQNGKEAAKSDARPDDDVLGLLSYSSPRTAHPDTSAPGASPWRSALKREDLPSEKKTAVAVEPEEPEDYAQLDKRKIGLLGGKGAGKTYFFNGIIYRTLTEEKAGAVSYYMRSSSLLSHDKPGQPGQPVDLYQAVNAYRDWIRFANTPVDRPTWYRLNLRFRTGVIGKSESHLELGFLDGSGDAYAAITDATKPIWKSAFSNAGIIIFCLPIWAAFPAKLSADDEAKRQLFLKEFFNVVGNYRHIRVPGLKVRSILALTMADDDRRCALGELIARWIKPYINNPEIYLEQLRRRTGIPRYLANAQAVSAYMHEKFRATDDLLVGRILDELDFGKGQPWIIPVSAVEGRTLEPADAMRNSGLDDSALRDLVRSSPVPVHVELPLLAALCENHNALM